METTCEEFLQVTDHNRVSASSEINIQPVLRWPTQNVIEAYKIARHSASAFIRKDAWNRMKHPPECRCSVCRGHERQELIERFGYLDDGSISKSGLRYFSALHDHQSDMQELEVFRKYTSSEGAREYDRRVDDNLSELKRLIKD